MEKAYIFLADGFEEIEGLTVVDILRRAGVEIQMVSIMGRKELTGSHGIPVVADAVFEEVDFSDGTLFVLPGGMPGTKRLAAHGGLAALLKEKNAEGFPMFMGYEWQGSGKDGDHNVFFLDNEQEMHHPLRYEELVKSYEGVSAIGIPHHIAYQLGSRGKNWETHNETFSPFVEIYSSHGCSESDDGH